MNDPTKGLLFAALAAAVPLRIAELQRQGGPSLQDWREARDFAGVLAEKGDNLMFRSPKKGETAKLFNGLAKALAVMSFVPGGVKFGPDHWESNYTGEGEQCSAQT